MLIFFDRYLDIVAATAAILGGHMIAVIFLGFVQQRLAAKSVLRMGHRREVKLTIEPNWFNYSDRLMEVSHRWTDIAKIGVTDHHALFFIEPKRAYVLPRRAFAKDENWFEFLEAANSFFASAKVAADNPDQPEAEILQRDAPAKEKSLLMRRDDKLRPSAE
jgi:hypothetical protein